MRFVHFRRMISIVLNTYCGSPTELDLVVVEEVRRHAGTTAAHIYGGLLGVLQADCERHGVPYTAYPVGTIKKRATGKGNAGKPQMIAAAKTRWPNFEIEDDNEADALWLGDLAASEHDPKRQEGCNG
jgi:Holliday junction resolvasome RuvABC endonuclease subunit